MSHVATVDIEIKDLAALKAACKRIGLEWREGKQTYKWYGYHVGDYPLPAGFTKDELGKCEHAIGVPGNERAYEIGVVKRKDGKPGLSMLWDFYQGGYGLEALAGANCNKLRQAYAVEAAKNAAKKQGFRVLGEKTLANGSVQLQVAK